MNFWQLFSESEDIWNEMLADIARAKVSIELEQYSFWDDKIGHRFLKLLYQKHQEGVRVRLICDGWGCYPLFQSRFVKKMLKDGVQLRIFNPFNPVKPSTWFYHLHKKTLVIDQELAWIGGMGIKKKFSRFKDVMIRFQGPIIADIQNSFEQLWSDIARKDYYHSPKLPQQSEDPQLAINYCGYGRKDIYEEMRTRIQNAKTSIYLTTSYFFPDRNFFQLILDKAYSGVDVKIIVRGKDDELLPIRFSSSYYLKALKAKIQIYRFQTGIIHAKTAIVDETWATVGSCNLDKFSFYYNMEANISTENPELVKAVSEKFQENLSNCQKIELDVWEKRPWYERLIEIIIWPIHNYL